MKNHRPALAVGPFALRVFRRALIVTSVCLALVATTACPKRTPWPQADGLTAEVARKRLLKDGERRERMGAFLKARMDGLVGLLAKADVDVIVEVPTRVHFSVRSFFEQPLLVFATDGVSATVLDGTNEAGPAFYKGPVTSKLLSTFLRTPVWPHEVVALFLGIAPVAGAKAEQIAIDEDTGTYSLALRPRRGDVSVVTARLQDDALTKIETFDADGTLRYRMTYSDFRPQDGISFAHRWTFEATTDTGKVEGIHFVAEDAQFNGERFDDRAFALQLPPGMEWRKLSDLQIQSDAPVKKNAPSPGESEGGVDSSQPTPPESAPPES